MNSYPKSFDTTASATHGTQSAWKACSADHEIAVSIPPEFAGPGGAFSPEDLFAQALTNCFLGTFKVLAENSNVSFRSVDVHGRLLVDLDERKKPCMHAFHLEIKLALPSDEARAKRLVEKALQSGFILNSVKTAITHELSIG